MAKYFKHHENFNIRIVAKEVISFAMGLTIRRQVCIMLLLSLSIALNGNFIVEKEAMAQQQSFSEDISFIQFQDHQWMHDNISVQILDASSMIDQSTGYVKDVLDAINQWSLALKSHSGNNNAWEFDVTIGDSTTNITPDILIILRDDPLEEMCHSSPGYTFYPAVESIVVQSEIFTFCGDDINLEEFVYGTALHEFGHALGLRHAFFIEDLMCSHEQMRNGTLLGTCDADYRDYDEPTSFDVYALLHMYGNDGFAEPNRKLSENSIYTHEMLSKDLNRANQVQFASGSSSTTQSFVTYTNHTYGIQFNHPGDWHCMGSPIQYLVVTCSPASSDISDILSSLANDILAQESESTILDRLENSFGDAGLHIAAFPHSNQPLNDYVNEDIRQIETLANYNLVSSQPYIIGSDIPAHQLIYTFTLNGEDRQVMTIWTITDIRAYQITYLADRSVYSTYLPVVESMINSLQLIS
jgi:predicted Zn-dependent protease